MSHIKIGLPFLLSFLLMSCGDRSTEPTSDTGPPVDTGPGVETGPADKGPGSDQTLVPDTGPPPCSPCTDPATCCSEDTMKCHGDPDKGVVCICVDLWDCSSGPNTCEQYNPEPTDTDPWSCTWTKQAYTCELASGVSLPPSVDPEWSCSYDSAKQLHTCIMTPPPNPCNSQDGVYWWTCTASPSGILVCTK